MSALTPVLVATVLVGGCSATATASKAPPVTAAPTTAAPPPASPSLPDGGADGTALAALETLPVKGRAPRTGYERGQFGPAWTDADRNGCDTRNDVLARDLTVAQVEPGTRGCVVVSGTLQDPYSGRTLGFARGTDTSSQVQIDHVVALGDAWQKGAQSLDSASRTALANDPLNLLAVDGPLNGAKGDGDAATWLPPNRGARCSYVARQVAVKARYGLWVTSAERDATSRVLGTCPDEPLPTGGLAPPARTDAESSPTAPTPSYASCTQVRAAGAAPIRAGDPGFERRFDRDGDGTGCDG